MLILPPFTISCVNIRNKYLLRINMWRKKTTDQATDTETDTDGLKVAEFPKLVLIHGILLSLLI